MEPTTLKCIVRYDGACFSGWQKQDNARSVQGELERCLSRIANAPVTIQGAGRTDAGVHAMGQVFSCRWPGRVPERLAAAVTKMLAPEVQLVSAVEAAPDFNARFDAHWKRYEYAFYFSRMPDPFAAPYSWHVPYAMDLDLLRSCLPLIVGKHDFAGFQSTGTQMKNTVRTIYTATLEEGGFCGPRQWPGMYRLVLCGDGFLYKMVRNLSGTLVEIARGRFEPSFITDALARGGPFLGHCAPPHGLVLAEVRYDAWDHGAGVHCKD